MFSLTLILLVLVVAVTFEYEFKCPESGEWRLRAIGFNCSIISQYVCIFRYPEREYHETCDGLDYSNIGSKLIYEPFFNKAYCSYERYQPFPFSTDGSSKCVYQKSFCTEKGQYLFQRGSQRSDITCGCDLTRGYEFTNKPSHDCYCVPSKDDCSCHKLPCNYLVDQCPQDRDEILTRSLITTVKDNRFNDAVNIFNDKNNGKKYRFQCLYITSLLLVVMIIAVTIVFALLKLQDDLHGYIIEQPPITIKVLEGQPAELKYKLSDKRFPVMFFKNNMFIPESARIKKSVFGSSKILNFTNLTLDDAGSYCIMMGETESNHTELIVDRVFTSTIEPHECSEGDSIQLTCSVYADNIEVKWYKEEHELQFERYLITSSDHDHMLTIKNSTIGDSGMYHVKAKNVQMKIPVKVKAIITRPLENVTIMEGLDTVLECETEEENRPVQWFKNGKEISNQSDIIKMIGKVHRFTILQTSLEDSGTYTVKTKGRTSHGVLIVKEMPATIKQMSVQERDEFLKAAKSGTTIRYDCRVMIVGENEVGKTSLLRRLMNEKIDDVRSTAGINILRRKCQINVRSGEWHFPTDSQIQQPSLSGQTEEYADCGFWDFAGQKEFYATHQVFLCTNAVYLLVVDISRDFKTKTINNMIEKEFNNVGEYIDFWLDNIHCYSIDDKNKSSHYYEDGFINPPVIIVGTGIDKIKQSERDKMIQLFQDHLNEDLNVNDKRRHIRKVHFLSNKFPKDYVQEFQRLRENIFSEAKALDNWGDLLPTRWIILEKEICMRREEHVLKYTDAKELATACSFCDVANTTSELESFLKYEHDIGNIIFFKDVNYFIVLDPEWLANVFRCFVSHQYKDELIGMPEWAILTKRGILKENLIDTLLKKLPSLTSTEHKAFVLQLMEKFDIIVTPKNNYFEQHIYMPCMIKPMPFKDIFGKNDIENCKKSSWFCLVFNFLPPSYFNHILVSFVKSKQLVGDEKDKKLGIYRNIGIFNLNETDSEIVVICLSKNLIAMQVRQLKNEDVCYSYVKKQLISLVDSIKQRYRINVFYEFRFKCQDESLLDNDGIGYDEAIEKIEYQCTVHDGMHSTKDIYRSWLTEEEIEEERKRKGHRKCNYCKHMSVYKCYDCNQVLCKDCSRKHGNTDKYSTHIMQLISDSFILNCKFSLDDDINENRLIRDIQCLPDDEVVAAVYTKGIPELIVFSLSGKRRHVIQLDTFPRKMDAVDKNTVAVFFANYRMALVDIQQNHVQYIRNVAMPYSSFTFLVIENEFYISEKYDIVVIDTSGSVKRRIKLRFLPYDMCYDVDSQHIYCIDREHSQLLCINTNGTIIFTFTDPSMSNLNDLTIDNEGNVLVLCGKEDDNSGYSVIKVDYNGEKSEVVITNIKTSPFHPRICYDHLTNSVVIGSYCEVYIYKRK